MLENKETPPCPTDINGDGITDVVDLTELIVSWGDCGAECPADVTGDGVVDVADLVELMLSWGTCG